MEDNIKATVEVTTRCIVMGIVEKTIGDAFMGGYDEQNEGIKIKIRKIVGGALVTSSSMVF